MSEQPEVIIVSRDELLARREEVRRMLAIVTTCTEHGLRLELDDIAFLLGER